MTYRDAIGKALTVAPAIVLTNDREQARAVHEQLTALRRWHELLKKHLCQLAIERRHRQWDRLLTALEGRSLSDREAQSVSVL